MGLGAIGVTASGQLSTLLLALLDDAILCETYTNNGCFKIYLTIYLSVKKQIACVAGKSVETAAQGDIPP